MTASSTSSALVTGAASGIGRAAALRLAAVDRIVVAIDRDRDGLERTVEAVRAAGGHCVSAAADVTSSEQCAAAVATALKRGRLELLVNAAGVMTAHDSAEQVTDEQVRHVLDVNVGAVFRMCRYAIPAMRAGGGGAIVNVASVHAYATTQTNAVYAASKGALVALTRQMALDVAGDGIRVVGVAPGAVDTPMSRGELERRGISAEEAGFSTGRRGIGRVARPEEVADVIAWLVSSEAALITGTTVVADAGLLAKLV